MDVSGLDSRNHLDLSSSKLSFSDKIFHANFSLYLQIRPSYGWAHILQDKFFQKLNETYMKALKHPNSMDKIPSSKDQIFIIYEGKIKNTQSGKKKGKVFLPVILFIMTLGYVYYN